LRGPGWRRGQAQRFEGASDEARHVCEEGKRRGEQVVTTSITVELKSCLAMRILAKKQCLALSLLYVHHGGFVFVYAMSHAAERPERGLRLLLHTRNKDTKKLVSARLHCARQWARLN
jgi:hypothetical protein